MGAGWAGIFAEGKGSATPEEYFLKSVVVTEDCTLGGIPGKKKKLLLYTVSPMICRTIH